MSARMPRVDADRPSAWPLDAPGDGKEHSAGVQLQELPIGELIARGNGWTEDQVQQILLYQRARGIRFGEAAVALKLASGDEVLRALSQQFHYAYSPDLLRGDSAGELVVAANPFSDGAEAFRELRSQLLMGPMGELTSRRALAVLSADSGDGKTYIAANLAVAFSQLGGRTLLMDADMRTPRLHKLFQLEQTSGLSNVLSGRAKQNTIHQVKDLPSLYILPVGAVPPNPLELVQRPAFGIFLNELISKFDHVLVDTPAAVHGADARVIAARAGAALVVGRKGRSRMSAMQSLVKKLGKGPIAIAGVVINEN
jgi:chain length determinant protein tyrosine kinase EpsG